MSRRTLGLAMAAGGGIVLALSLLADPLGLGSNGDVGLKQAFGAVVGAAALLGGLALAYLPRRGEVEPGAEE